MARMPMPDAVFTLPEAAHPKIRMLHDYWLKAAPAADLLPGRRQIDPLHIPKLLENIWLMDVVGQPPRFRMRLVGGAMRRMGILVAPGNFVEQFMPEDAPPLGDLRAMVQDHRPVWFRGQAYLPHETQLFALERLFLPLADDGRQVDVILGLTIFFDWRGREL